MLQPALSINLMDPNKLARMQNAFDVQDEGSWKITSVDAPTLSKPALNHRLSA